MVAVDRCVYVPVNRENVLLFIINLTLLYLLNITNPDNRESKCL
jgi:hypothetical protein